MDINKLKKANHLIETIQTTNNAIVELNKIKDKVKLKTVFDNDLDDGLYSFSISEYKDGSGLNAVLNRYGGNLQLLDAIIITLEVQLKKFDDEFKNL